MIKQYGLKFNEKDDERAWKLGGTELPRTILVEDGDWNEYLPDTERQHFNGYDTYGCTIYGHENIQQILEKFHNGKTNNYSERYNYNLVGINPPGADPHDAAECFRLKGVIPQDKLPVTDSYVEYATPRPVPRSMVKEGIAHPYELRHQYLWNRSIKEVDRTKLIREYLKYSPLGVSVTAWQKKDGVYVDGGQPNTHWTVIYGEEKGKGWKVYDSYSPYTKILSYNHAIQVCKRYELVPSVREYRISLLQKAIDLISEIIEAIFPPAAYDVDPKDLPMNQKPKEEPTKKPQETLYQEALAWLGSDASPDDYANDELGCAESVSNIIRNSIAPDFPILTWTPDLLRELRKDKRFKATLNLEPGNIIVSPTGSGNGSVIGHTGIFLKDKKIASNTSKNGLWEQNYTIDSWVKRYRKQGSMPLYVFEAV